VNAAVPVQPLLNASSTHEQVDDEDDQKQTADAAPYHWTAIIVAASATEEQQKDENDQDQVQTWTPPDVSSVTIARSVSYFSIQPCC